MTESEANFPYLPHTDAERKEMLKSIGVASFEELVKHIPEKLRAKALNLRGGLSEQELAKEVQAISNRNMPASRQASFLGGGSYRRYVPAIVGNILSRGEFSTAYTPYQPEVSQGTLQAIYEFQTAICLLTGMEVANASMYDGPTALAEACLMSSRLTTREKIVVAASVNPEYKEVVRTYCQSCGLEYQEAQIGGGNIDDSKLTIDDKISCVVVQYPNYFGCLEDLEGLAKKAHAAGAHMVVVSEPISLGLLTAPGDFGADIVVGDAQPCGNSLSFGGPSAGYMATKKEFIRQLPGRLCGVTVDNRGQRAFTLTLQTREQHIRRAKATSNICTNQALNALAMLVYIVSVGPVGLKELANISLQRAHNLMERLTAISGIEAAFPQPFFNEFVIKTSRPAQQVLDELKAHGVLGGIDLSSCYPELKNHLLVAVTEMNSPDDLDRYVSAMDSVMKGNLKTHDKEAVGSAPAKTGGR
jgi:glycine dehydrogenase subunit 1